MKKEMTVLVLMILIILGLFFVLTYPFDNKPESNTVNKVNTPLDIISLNTEDVKGNYELISEKHITEKYNSENTTGNGLIWNISEHYQSLFMENKTSNPIAEADPTNKITQSLTKLESIEKAEYYVILKKPSLLEKKNYTVLSIGEIGSESFYLTTKVNYEDNKYDYYLLCFSIGDVVVTIGGLDNDENTYFNYGKIIEDNIMDSVVS